MPPESRPPPYIGHSSNASPALKLTLVCLGVCVGGTSVMHVTRVLHRRAIASKRVLTFQVTRLLLTQLLVLVEWELS